MTTSGIYNDGTYTAKNPTYHTEDSPWKASKIAAVLGDNLKNCHSIVEVGCGAGDILRALRPLRPKARMYGYDINPDAISMADSKPYDSNMRFYAEDFAQNARAYGQFDLLLLMDVFEHVEDYIGFLKALRPRANNFVFHIPLDLSSMNLLRPSFLARKRARVGHLHYFTKDTAIATLEHCGYRIMRHAYTESGANKDYGLLNRVMRIPRAVGSFVAPDFTVRVLGGSSLIVWAINH